MQPSDWSPSHLGTRALALGLVVLLVGSMFASVAAAGSAIALRNADVSATTVTVGENVTVTANAVNVGDSGGGYTFEFKRNGTDYGTTWTTFASRRVTLAADEYRSVNATVQFDEPGTYGIRVNDKRAGVVRVQSARTQVDSVSDTQRRVDVRANGVSTSEPTDFEVPPSNLSVGLERWSTTTGQSAFQQYLTEYTNRSEVPETLPSRADSTLLGVVTFESDDDFDEATMRLAVDSGALSNSTVAREDVTVYQRNGDIWERLETTLVAAEANRTVYEATVTRGTTYAVGRIDPNVSVANTSYGTTASAGGQRLYVDARVRNDAPIAGSYTGELRVNGEVMNRTTITVPASGEARVSLSHTVSEAGTYTLELDRTAVGSVLIAESQVGDTQSPGSSDADGTGSPTATATGVGESGDDAGLADALPATVLGIDTLYVAGGLAIALGAFVAIWLLLRRGGDGGGGRPDSFDPW
ncbi:hypothetical protein [Haloarcula onubensis]|uniref:PGF-pre-PGF domain-containing protein n=1 Tax=Haloarcula onubensis TaxID=2950539 RepID=A0ABU2FVD4_9EURY|nr:hypothetical protein [Halomicroarcula sp. S3CR25-11]MDS0284197.1 hypothetical protein [Halomicroarcula sp. S3CR25-11]